MSEISSALGNLLGEGQKAAAEAQGSSLTQPTAQRVIEGIGPSTAKALTAMLSGVGSVGTVKQPQPSRQSGEALPPPLPPSQGFWDPIVKNLKEALDKGTRRETSLADLRSYVQRPTLHTPPPVPQRTPPPLPTGQTPPPLPQQPHGLFGGILEGLKRLVGRAAPSDDRTSSIGQPQLSQPQNLFAGVADRLKGLIRPKSVSELTRGMTLEERYLRLERAGDLPSVASVAQKFSTPTPSKAQMVQAGEEKEQSSRDSAHAKTGLMVLASHAGKAGKALGIVGGIAAGASLVVKGLNRLGESAIESQRYLADFNGAIAGAFAGLKVHEIQMAVRAGTATAESTKELIESKREADRAWEGFSHAMKNITNDLKKMWYEAKTFAGKLVGAGSDMPRSEGNDYADFLDDIAHGYYGDQPNAQVFGVDIEPAKFTTKGRISRRKQRGRD